MHNFKGVESIVEDKKVNTATSVLHFSKILIDNKLSKRQVLRLVVKYITFID